MEATENSSLVHDWRIITSLALIAIFALYFYIMSGFDYWTKRGIPQISGNPVPFFGHTFKLMVGQRNFIDTFEDLYKAAGDAPYAGFFQGTIPCLLVRDPETVKNILIKDFNVFTDRAFDTDEEIDPLNGKAIFNLKGQRWKDMRARLSPTFTSGRMKAMLPLMQVCSDELIQCLYNKIGENGGEAIIEIKDYMTSFTTEVIASCAFGIKCDALQNPETSEFRRMGKLSFEPTFRRNLLFVILLISPKLLKILGLKFTDDESSVFFRNFVKDIMAKREAEIEENGGDMKGFGDFIHHLVLLKKRGFPSNELRNDEEHEDFEEYEEGKEQVKVEPSWTNLSFDDLTAQVMLFFSAGFETTSTLLSFALFELSCSSHGKELQKKLREEVQRVIKEDGGKITYDGLKRMHLLDRVLNETLRMYPPVGMLARETTQAYTIPGTNHKLDKRTKIFIPIQAMQREEKFFPNPTNFDPDRFLPKNKEQWNQFSYLPFGEGPRNCIGKRFADMQARLGLASLISKFEFNLCREKTSVPLRFKKKAFILTAEEGLWLRVKEYQEIK